MKKILFIASIYPFLDGFEKNNIKICQQMGMKVYTAANILDTSTNIKYSTTNIDDLGVQKFNVDIHRSPFSLKNITKGWRKPSAYTILILIYSLFISPGNKSLRKTKSIYLLQEPYF